MSALSALLLLSLGVILAWMLFFGRMSSDSFRQRNEPPLDRGLVPWLGHALEFGGDASKFLSKMKKKYGDIFTVQVAGRFITVLLDPHSYDHVVWESHAKLDFEKYANILMERMFDLQLPNYDMKAEKSTLKMHLQKQNLPSLTRSMFHNLNTIIGHKALAAAEWKEEGLFDFAYSVMLRAGYLTLFGSESSRYTNSHGNLKDVQHSEEVYKEFRKLDRLLMKAARNMLSAEEKQKAASIKKRLWQLLDSESLKRKPNKSSWMESYQRHLEENQVTPEMQSRAMVLQLWATQGNAGPAAFWLLVFLLKHPEALFAVKRELEEVFQNIGTTMEHLEDIDQETLDNTAIFDSVFNECLRLTAAPFITREVLVDMSLKLADGREYRLRRGDRLCLFPYVSPQMDPEIHQQPEKFKYDRFLNPDGTRKQDFYKSGKQLRHSTMPWGAGSNICIGKSHAVNSIKQFVFFLFHHFDFELRNSSDEIPRFDKSRYGFGVMQPENDIIFRYRRKFLIHE
ncbi:prostacyclin synthase [Spea bombifrons]|uniref:prostacyclin synthase n=1 Tax=Spea bombifrons TaxID=233779 RepID=UPI002349A7D7|nr:prostacyclin synthase [Spea bombifrons]